MLLEHGSLLKYLDRVQLSSSCLVGWRRARGQLKPLVQGIGRSLLKSPQSKSLHFQKDSQNKNVKNRETRQEIRVAILIKYILFSVI